MLTLESVAVIEQIKYTEFSTIEDSGGIAIYTAL